MCLITLEQKVFFFLILLLKFKLKLCLLINNDLEFCLFVGKFLAYDFKFLVCLFQSDSLGRDLFVNYVEFADGNDPLANALGGFGRLLDLLRLEVRVR